MTIISFLITHHSATLLPRFWLNVTRW